MATTNTHQFQKLCDDIFALSPNIRFVGIINRMGKLVAGGMRQGLESLEDKEDSSRLFLEFALRSEMRKDFDSEFGRTIYSFSERERIKLASFPLNNHILRVSMEKQEQHHLVIETILKKIMSFKPLQWFSRRRHQCKPPPAPPEPWSADWSSNRRSRSFARQSWNLC